MTHSPKAYLTNHKGIINLDGTLSSGQVFHWKKVCDDIWEGLIENEFVRLKQTNEGMLEVLKGDREKIFHYFALDHDLGLIYANFPNSDYTNKVIEFCRGIRIIRQPFWECLATFLFSTQKRIWHIKQISWNLRVKFGEEIENSGHFSFPTVEQIASTPVAELGNCKLGFRARFLSETAKQLLSKYICEDQLSKAPTPELINQLCSLPGVGRKVAACVALFAFGRLEAVPVDVWIERVLQRIFPHLAKHSREKLEKAAYKKFGRYAGYFQQYLFHYVRTTKDFPSSASFNF
ncbi:MAG: hypothetical protein N2035_04710 [Chthoniobacterales bacterium]|nr:hypothetical protein [Chthoniobacterales bacterium]